MEKLWLDEVGQWARQGRGGAICRAVDIIDLDGFGRPQKRRCASMAVSQEEISEESESED